MKRPALQNKRVGVLRMAFRARKVFGILEKRAPGLEIFLMRGEHPTIIIIIIIIVPCSLRTDISLPRCLKDSV